MGGVAIFCAIHLDMEQKDFLELAAKVADGKASDEELRLYASVYEHFQQDVFAKWDSTIYGDETLLAAQLHNRLQPVSVRKIWPRVAVAAVVLLSVGIGGYFMLNKSAKPTLNQTAYQNDVTPGHNRATLTLANGKQIILTQQLNGQVAVQGQTQINASNGQLVYQPGTGEQQVSYNTLTTARGEQSPYPVVLADGTRVWLNAQSSLTFPSAFNGKERTIKLNGEAYFEVEHNAQHPFKVYTAGGVVEDLGTHFNIKAYADAKQEATTLLEGAVKINTASSSKLLKPGEQAKYKQTVITVQQVDAEEAIAWKNGYFMFTDEALADVMQELSRWYNVDVQFDDESLKQLTFVASITKYTNVSKVLQVLEMTRQVHFRIEGKVIKVYPNKTN